MATDWTKPKHLDADDHIRLAHIKSLCNKRQYKEAMEYARHECDTIIREEIPGDIWLKMGGTLTNAGMEKLNSKKKK